MRFLDIAVAALIGTSTIAGIAAFSPTGGDAASRGLLAEIQLRDELLGILQQKGIDWLIHSAPDMLCGYLRGESNSSVTFSATIGSYQCGPSPPEGAYLATLSLPLTPVRVVIEAWPSDPE